MFKLAKNGTTFKQEVLAGLTTFVTIAYILILQPHILAQAHLNLEASFLAVCLATAFGSAICGLLANLPFALAPGLGLLSFFSFVAVQKLGFSPQAGLAAVFIAGCLFLLITVSKIRQKILEAIPYSLGCAIAGGIGFFIGLIALKDVGLIVASKNTLVTLGHLDTPQILLFFLGFLLIAILDTHRIPGAILIGIIAISIVGMLFKISSFHGLFAIPDFSALHLADFDFKALQVHTAWPLVFTFLIVALFDSTGTIIGLSHQLPKQPSKRQVNRALLGESVATMFSSAVGASSTAIFVETASGIKAGGRTGLTSIVIAVMFLIMLFLSPLARSVPSYATSAALFYVSCMMIKPIAQVCWEDSSEFVPAIITLFMIPLTFSIADGVGLGLICFTILKVARGKWRELPWMLWVLAAIFVIYFAY